ncbi:hypothetical protein [Brevibacillus daliensis]|uniref:hypothetical protein n=1 Tax=Brevibacillus daliensis TaxID=2892995 RepID=UPI001E553392|nr:hypothetical protein [Brevibacillus daliensis]
MVKYTSRFPALMFYVEGEIRQFRSGEYVANTKAERDALDQLADVKRVDDPKQTEEPKPKPATTRKSSAK